MSIIDAELAVLKAVREGNGVYVSSTDDERASDQEKQFALKAEDAGIGLRRTDDETYWLSFSDDLPVALWMWTSVAELEAEWPTLLEAIGSMEHPGHWAMQPRTWGEVLERADDGCWTAVSAAPNCEDEDEARRIDCTGDVVAGDSIEWTDVGAEAHLARRPDRRRPRAQGLLRRAEAAAHVHDRGDLQRGIPGAGTRNADKSQRPRDLPQRNDEAAVGRRCRRSPRSA